MERLTHIDNKGWYVDDQSVAYDEKRRGKEVDRLSAYEDTGLEPEEVRIQYDILRRYSEAADGIGLKRIRELARAEKEGRLVVLPCKVGDLLYEVDLPEYGVITCKVLSIMYYKGPRFHVPGNEIVSSVDVEVEVVEGHGKGGSYTFELRDFGKAVFLTRQEAEEALG